MSVQTTRSMKRSVAQGFLGPPTTDERVTPNSLGSYRHYQGGSIDSEFADQVAHEVHGLIRDKWATLGWENSFLGFPITDEQDVADGPRPRQPLRGRVDLLDADREAHEVHGAIFSRWRSLAAPNDPEDVLGFPTTDELVTPNHTRPLQPLREGLDLLDADDGRPRDTTSAHP